jgi:hypothetical protein
MSGANKKGAKAEREKYVTGCWMLVSGCWFWIAKKIGISSLSFAFGPDRI